MLNYTEKLLKEEILNFTPIFLKSLNFFGGGIYYIKYETPFYEPHSGLKMNN